MKSEILAPSALLRTSFTRLFLSLCIYCSALVNCWICTSRTCSSVDLAVGCPSTYSPIFPFAGPVTLTTPISSPFSQTCILSALTLTERVFQPSRSTRSSRRFTRTSPFPCTQTLPVKAIGFGFSNISIRAPRSEPCSKPAPRSQIPAWIGHVAWNVTASR
ncbi:hypothetical protein ES703_50600 [subsurface metagenome]